MKQYFAKCNVFEKRQALDFQENFSCLLTKLPNIPGTTGDFLVETGPAPLQGRVIEFKFDKRSRFSKNIYVEFEEGSGDVPPEYELKGVFLYVNKYRITGDNNMVNYRMRKISEIQE